MSANADNSPRSFYRLAGCFSPLLLLLLAPFNISLGVFYPTLEKYGSATPYFIAFAFVGAGLLLFDYYVSSFRALRKDVRRLPVIGSIVVTSFAFRLTMFDFESMDYLGALANWYDVIKENGGFAALGLSGFSDYNLPYLYIMAFATYLPIHKLYAIKLASIFFDYLAAYGIFKIARVRLGMGNLGCYVWAGLFLFLPTVAINSALWAQCDITYVCFLIWTLYYMLEYVERDIPIFRFWAFIMWSIALMFKLQAVFFALPLLLFYAKKNYSLRWGALVVMVWLAFAFPSWLLGRPLADIALIYARQVVRYPALSINAASVYQFFPDAPFEIFNKAGIVFTLSVVAALGISFLSMRIKATADNLIRLAAISTLLIPFFLPKMHERYFFAADVMAFIYALWFLKKGWFVPLAIGFTSFMSYQPYLFESTPIPFWILSMINGGVLGFLLIDFAENNSLWRNKDLILKPKF